MNIEISKDTIEQMIKVAVDERVKAWFEEPLNKQYFRNKIANAIEMEVYRRVEDSMVDIPKLSSSLATKELADKIVDNIGYNIASIFAEKYGD